MSAHISNVRPDPDPLLVDLAEYTLHADVQSDEAYDTARWCLADTLACGIMALAYPACTKLLGPVVPGAAAGVQLVVVDQVPAASTFQEPPAARAE